MWTVLLDKWWTLIDEIFKKICRKNQLRSYLDWKTTDISLFFIIFDNIVGRVNVAYTTFPISLYEFSPSLQSLLWILVYLYMFNPTNRRTIERDISPLVIPTVTHLLQYDHRTVPTVHNEIRRLVFWSPRNLRYDSSRYKTQVKRLLKQVINRWHIIEHQ